MGEGVLPIDLLLEILHRLPAKSLLRFRSVSKPWGCFMHDPDFISRHIRQVAESNSSTIITSNYDADVSFSRADSPPNLLSFSCKANKDLEVTGSCNGLLCLVFQKRFVIISNLLIKDHHLIPMPSSTRCKEVSELIQVGFGYDSVKDDYKVVTIVLHRDRKSGRCIADTSVYSLRCNKWGQTKRLKLNAVGRIKKYAFLARSDGVVVSGALHWFASDHTCKLFTVAFHLTTEEFYDMSLPDQVSVDGMMITYLTRMGVLNGCLCVSSGASRDQPDHDIWVMKEYGIHSSWTKLFRLTPSLGGSPFGVSALTPLIHFKKEGQVLLLQGYHKKPYSFHLYDMRDKKQMECVSNFVNWGEVKAICVATIVSLSDYKALWDEKDLSWKGRLRKRRRKEDSSSGGTDKIKDDVEKQAQPLKAFEDDLEKNVQALKAFFYLRDRYIKGLSSNLRGEQKP